MSMINLQLSPDDLGELREDIKHMVNDGIQQAIEDYSMTDDVLNGVKSINAYLHCSYTTYKKLVICGLPIHRFGSLIFGSKKEINNWIKTNGDKIN